MTEDQRQLADEVAGYPRHTAPRRAGMAEGSLPPEAPRPPLLARAIVWGTALLCLILLLATAGEAWTVHQLNQQVAANQQIANQLQAQNQQLTTQNQQLQQPETIEQEARQLGFIFPGDQPVVVVGGMPAPPPAHTPPPPAPNPWGFWSDWLKLFFGN